MLVLLLACVAPDTEDARPPRPRLDDTDAPEEIERLPGVPVPPDDDTRVFNLDAVHAVDLTLAPGARRGLELEPYTYVAAELVFDGVAFANVGVRLKGRLGSLRSLDGKAAFKIDFLEFGENTRLEGLERINLNNMVQDCAKVHEYAAYGVHRMLGTPAPRVAYATVTVNGEDFGLYSLVEDYDDVFLEKNFADASGNLYDGDYALWPDGSYTLVDFTDGGQNLFTLDEGVDVGLADVAAVTGAVRAGGAFEGGLGDLVDLEQHAAFLAVNAWTGHSDSYTYFSNNYRVYFDPARGGRAVFLPWDPDWAYTSSTAVTTLYGVVSQRCHADAACNAAVHAALDTLAATAPGSTLVDEIGDAVALIRPALEVDPRLESLLSDIRACQADQFDWFDRRSTELLRTDL